MESNSLRAAVAFSATRPAKPILAAGFELAHFIHRSRERAQRVVETAASHLDRACDAQLKRVYYHVRGQPSSQKSDQFRSKVILDEPQLFQPIAELDHASELSRIHALLHPQCLKKICHDVGLDPPDGRLRIPRLGVC